MSAKGYISVTRSHEDALGNVTAEQNFRIHYVCHPGCDAVLYGTPQPAEDATVEFDFLEIEDFEPHRSFWKRTTDTDTIEWAEEYLEGHADEAFEDVAAQAEAAAEYRAECRRESV